MLKELLSSDCYSVTSGCQNATKKKNHWLTCLVAGEKNSLFQSFLQMSQLLTAGQIQKLFEYPSNMEGSLSPNRLYIWLS